MGFSWSALCPWQRACLQLVGLFAVARLIEVGASVIRARYAANERAARPLTEGWWPSMVAVHVAVFVGTAAHVLASSAMPPRPLVLGALAALVAATLLRAWVLVALGPRWNVRVLDPGSIVTHGPYRFVRHPSYLAVIIEVAALPLVVGAYAVAIVGSLANALLLARRIPFEEWALCARHAVYRDVMMARPRFLPRFGAVRSPVPRPH